MSLSPPESSVFLLHQQKNRESPLLILPNGQPCPHSILVSLPELMATIQWTYTLSLGFSMCSEGTSVLIKPLFLFKKETTKASLFKLLES